MNTTTHKKVDYLIVGAGFAGAVLAERLAADLNKKVLVIDKRPHIAGNAYDCFNKEGILIHQYGPHIFHTNSEKVLDYLSQFTEWGPYTHRVLAHIDQQLLPVPINLTTLNKFYNLNMDGEEAEAFLAAQAEPVAEIITSADIIIDKIGRDLYEKFFRGYTRKQWGLDPSQLDKSVTARIPTRTNADDRYFTDQYQCMPRDGYTQMFEKMLDHPNITVLLETNFKEIKRTVAYDKLIYTGPIDEYFDYCFGKLPYRSLRFRHETLDQAHFQPTAVVNYPSEEVDFTRITEYKHLTGQIHPQTSLSWEYPCAEGEPYYPIPRVENQSLYKKYEALSEEDADTIFLGRLGSYRYYNMDQVVGQALAAYKRIAEKEQAYRMPIFEREKDEKFAIPIGAV